MYFGSTYSVYRIGIIFTTTWCPGNDVTKYIFNRTMISLLFKWNVLVRLGILILVKISLCWSIIRLFIKYILVSFFDVLEIHPIKMTLNVGSWFLCKFPTKSLTKLELTRVRRQGRCIRRKEVYKKIIV